MHLLRHVNEWLNSYHSDVLIERDQNRQVGNEHLPMGQQIPFCFDSSKIILQNDVALLAICMSPCSSQVSPSARTHVIRPPTVSRHSTNYTTPPRAPPGPRSPHQNLHAMVVPGVGVSQGDAPVAVDETERKNPDETELEITQQSVEVKQYKNTM